MPSARRGSHDKAQGESCCEGNGMPPHLSATRMMFAALMFLHPKSFLRAKGQPIPCIQLPTRRAPLENQPLDSLTLPPGWFLTRYCIPWEVASPARYLSRLQTGARPAKQAGHGRIQPSQLFLTSRGALQAPGGCTLALKIKKSNQMMMSQESIESIKLNP